MKKVAQVFGTSIQPYLMDWTDALKNDDLDFQQFLGQQTPDNAAYKLPVLGTNTDRFDKWIRLLSITRRPADALDWLRRDPDCSIKQQLSLWAAYSPLISYRPDVVHLINSYLYGKFAGLLSGMKSRMVVSFRGFDTYIRPLVEPGWKDELTRIFDEAACLHFVSNDLMRSALELGAPEQKCVMIYPGIKLDSYEKSSSALMTTHPGTIRLVSVGRLTWEKGYPVAIKAVRKLLDAGYDLNYQIIGDGPQRAEIAFLVQRLALKDYVLLCGVQASERVRQALDASHIYVQPSLSEALGVAVLEASAMELPVVCTSAGGLPEAVDCDVTGIVVPPASDEELAKAIVCLMENPDLRQRMGKAGREKVQRQFSLMDEVQKWQQHYARVAQ
jgi:colanic acid/amylovoran biosynthesis glycosyltransferase